MTNHDELKPDTTLDDLLPQEKPATSVDVKGFLKEFTEKFSGELEPTEEEWEKIQAAQAGLQRIADEGERLGEQEAVKVSLKLENHAKQELKDSSGLDSNAHREP